MAPGSRPDKRVLVRWSDDLDKSVLLGIQYACTEAGIKIPWARVADVMGEKFTEGSIVQHLAKLRAKMVAVGMHVPPPLRRGMVTKEPSKIYAPAPKKRKAIESAGADPNAGFAAPNSRRPAAKVKAKGKIKRPMSEEDEDEEGSLPSLSDTDEDYGTVTKRRAKRLRKLNTAIKKEDFDDVTKPAAISSPPKQEDESDSDINKIFEEKLGPAARTRGLKTNYAKLDGNESDDYIELEEDDIDEKNIVADLDEDLEAEPLPHVHDAKLLQIAAGFAKSEQVSATPSTNLNVGSMSLLTSGMTTPTTIKPMMTPAAMNDPTFDNGFDFGAIDFNVPQNDGFPVPIHPESISGDVNGQRFNRFGPLLYGNQYGMSSAPSSFSVSRNNSSVSIMGSLTPSSRRSFDMSRNHGAGGGVGYSQSGIPDMNTGKMTMSISDLFNDSMPFDSDVTFADDMELFPDLSKDPLENA